jgi:site-specific recombinase XerD
MKNYQINPDKFLTRKERDQLLKACKERAELDELKGRKTWPVRYMLVDLAFYSGLRVAEMAALKIGDINLSGEPYIMVRNGKGGKDRAVYIDKALAKHIKAYIKNKPLYGHESHESAPLFSGNGGGHMPTISLQKSFKKAVEVAGLSDHHSIHNCRHTYATFLLSDTKNLRFVQKQLGHASLNMTSLYADIEPEENGGLANMIQRG